MVYDDSIEKRINSLICKIDEHPVIKTQPVEESSYLGIKLRTSEDGFYQSVKILYNEFTDYLNEFIKKNRDPHNLIQDVTTQTRLLSLYQISIDNIRDSPKRIEWRTLSKHFTLTNPNNDYEIQREIKYNREANMFFLKMSNVQHFFLERLVDYIERQVEADKIGNTIINNDPSKSRKKKDIPPELLNNFIVEDKFTNKYHIHLNRLYEGLKDELQFIDCSQQQFKELFRKSGKPSRKTPKPIIWLSKEYSYLCYFIQCLVNIGFIPNSRQPSFNHIALNLFFKQEEGVYFTPSDPKCDIKDNKIDPYPKIRAIVLAKLKE